MPREKYGGHRVTCYILGRDFLGLLEFLAFNIESSTSIFGIVVPCVSQFAVFFESESFKLFFSNLIKNQI